MHAPATSPPAVRVSLTVPFPPDELAECVFSPRVLAYWLDGDAVIAPQLGSRASLPVAKTTGSYFTVSAADGTVTQVQWPAHRPAGPSRRVRRRAAAAGAAPERAAPRQQASGDGDVFEMEVTLTANGRTHQVRFRITPSDRNGCRFRVEYIGALTADERRSSVKLWQTALNRLGRFIERSVKNRRRERQAIIVVHGIGEQRPGQHLRQFVSNVFDRTQGEVFFVKPDYLSASFEMRMATVPRIDGERPTTDVYELYWAHLIRDTTLSQVYGWILRLLLAGRAKVPRTLTAHVWALRVLVIAVAGIAMWVSTKDVSKWLAGFGIGALLALPAIGKAILGLFQETAVIGYAGDAARYLEPRPENITRRQEIREAGIALLDAMHDEGRYERIILYGHSLGSVVAYDMLCHAWARRSRVRTSSSRVGSRALRKLEDLLPPPSATDGDRAQGANASAAMEAQPLQHAAWREYRENGFSWRISDFVTAGSPLTHAPWLLNLDGATQFRDLVKDRSFPSCPPQTELVNTPKPGVQRQRFTFTHAYLDEIKPSITRSVQVPHHAGVFALTRWTNLFFPFSGVMRGDPVGGPVAPQFGNWVSDIALPDTDGFAHIKYTADDANPDALQSLREALHLPFRRRLVDYAPDELHPTELT